MIIITVEASGGNETTPIGVSVVVVTKEAPVYDCEIIFFWELPGGLILKKYVIMLIFFNNYVTIKRSFGKFVEHISVIVNIISVLSWDTPLRTIEYFIYLAS